MFKQFLTITILSLFMFSACKKEGCTNDKASNFNAEAKKDDGSCIFPDPEPANYCGLGNLFCVNIDGQVYASEEVELIELPTSNLIYWHAHNPDNEVQIYIYGEGIGEYEVDTTEEVGTAKIQVHLPGEVQFATSGTVEISTWNESPGITGTFHGAFEDGRTLSDGHFFDVVKL